MPTRLTNYFLRTLREDPADAEVTSHKLLVRAGYIRRQAPGVFAWLPLGLRVKAKIEAIIREEMTNAGAHEVHFPALLPREPYEVTNRWTEYGDGLFRLQDRKGADYLLAPTHEEVFTLLVKDLYNSYKDLPLSIYQIQDKYRDEARPRAGLLRGREFTMKDAYSFDVSDAGLDASYQAQRDAYERIFARLGLEYVIVQADAGAMGGSKSEEFLHPTPVGEDTFVRSAGGYAANVEAFQTIVPESLPIDGQPAPVVFDSPNTPTILTLVDHVNEHQPRTDRAWRAADTLKNVVLALTHLDGTRELVVVGMPGDREVEVKRAEVAFAPAEVEAATESDFAKHPGLVKGYIGPWSAEGPVLGEASRQRHPVPRRPARRRRHRVGDRREPRPEARALARRRPRLRRRRRHRHLRRARRRPRTRRLGPGRARPRHGDRARVPARPQVRRGARPQGARRERQARDRHHGLVRHRRHPHPRDPRRRQQRRARAWCGPPSVAPFDVHVLATGKDAAVFDAAETVVAALEASRFDVLYDDRPKLSPGVKFADAELIGVPKIVIAGRGVADGIVEVWDRATGDRTSVPIDGVVAALGR